jgi:hypothetical protein
MNLALALEEHERQLGTSAGARRRAALRLLREYFVEYADIPEIEALAPADLEDLLARWYLCHEQADPEGALDVLDAVEAWLRWLDRGDEESGRSAAGRTAPFLALAERLREDLPRAIEAYRLLRAHVHRHALAGVTAEDEAGEPLFRLTGGLSHVVRPDEVEYARAEQDHFRVESIEGDQAALQSPSGARLGQPPLFPVLLPPGVGPLLRKGDTLCVEVAPRRRLGRSWLVSRRPGARQLSRPAACFHRVRPRIASPEPRAPRGWEVLEVSGVFPGGYHAAAL